jgi:hypothetical protein
MPSSSEAVVDRPSEKMDKRNYYARGIIMKLSPKTHALVAATFLSVVIPSAQSSDAEWEFEISPLFLWGVSIDGDATIGSETVPLDIEFKDGVLENLEAVFTLHFEARKDKMTLFAEYQYLDLTPEVVIGPVETNIDFKNTMFEAGIGYAIADNDRTRWEVLFGLRYSDQEVDVDVTLNFPPPPDGPGPLTLDISGGDDWLHPFLGVRVDHSLGERWSFRARADYGYADSNNTAINAAATFNYRFRDWGSVFGGYRILKYDYDNGKSSADHYAYDAVQQGPLLGFSFHW